MSVELTRYGSLEELSVFTRTIEGDVWEKRRTSDSKNSGNKKDDKDTAEIKYHPFFNPWVYLLFTCLANVCYLSAVAGIISASLNTIERRFQLKSSESGAITIINDVTGMISVLFLTHFAHSRHRPRIVGTCFALVGLGTILCAMPHFIYTPPESLVQKMLGIGTLNNETGDMGSAHRTCSVGYGRNNSTSNEDEQCNAQEEHTSGSLVWQIGWILFGQILCGLGTCAQPLCITYLDDNVRDKRIMPVFIGIIFSCFSLGPTTGYLLATYCLAKPTYFHDPSYPIPTVSQGHPYYIGAWWLGFLINGGALIVLSIPFFFFPKSMRSDSALQTHIELTAGVTSDDGPLERIHLDHTSQYQERGLGGFFKGFFGSVKRTLKNLTAMSVFLASCAELTGVAGWFVFGPKFLYTQYGLPPAKASMLFGLFILPGPILGNIVASLIVRKLRLSSRGCAKMVLIIFSITVLTSPLLYWMGCDNPNNVGLTASYNQDTYEGHDKLTSESYDLTSSCNSDCDCEPDFVPVCGSDGLTYPTACHAGCQSVGTMDNGEANITMFVDCRCIPPGTDNSTDYPLDGAADSGFAFQGECPWTCNRIVFFFAMMPIGSLIQAMYINPSFMLQFRSHREEDRSTALGVNNVLLKCLALIPAPIYFGALVEKTCLLFQQSCGKTGNCIVYDIVGVRLLFTLFASCGKVIGLCLYIVAFLSVRNKK